MGRTVIVTVGTRGDVVPYAALGAALAAAGDEVVVATHPSLRRHVDEAGLGFAPLPDLDTGQPLTSARFARLIAARWPDICRATLAAARDADLLLLAPMGLAGYHVAEATGAVSMGAFLQPLEPTTAFPPPMLTTRSLGGWGNRAAARAFRVAGQAPFARATAQFRRELGLPPLGPGAMFRRMEAERWPALYGFSPAVAGAPADWPAHRPMTGYWWPRAPSRLSARVRDFLDAGEPPVFAGFGSMVAPALDDLVDRAVTRLGRRVIVQRDSASPVLRKNVLVVGEEPHAELFPRVATVLHHGGAGTTAAALRAGVPAVTVPFTADQPFWGRRVAALGAGPAPIPVRRLTCERLVRAVEEAAGHRPGAAAVARQLAAEDGIGAALGHMRTVRSP